MSSNPPSPLSGDPATQSSSGGALFLRVLGVALALYAFLVGIGAMGTAFKWMGKGYTTELLGGEHGPLVSLFIGILATTLVQSSSTTTSLVVGMVAAGALQLDSAVFMVMGANLGTTVTNTIVSLGHITQSSEYRRAFAAATVHDFFNIMVLLVLFPLEIATGFLHHFSGILADTFSSAGGLKLANPLKAATKPVIGGLKDLIESTGSGGLTMAIVAVLITFVGLVFMVKLLKSIMVTRLQNLFDRVIFKNAGRSLVFGVFLTILVQSSSITTSVAVPLVGAGVLTIHQVFPYTMGANIGTTMTSMLAAMAAYAGADAGDLSTALLGLNLALFHVLFNVLGVVLIWPLRRVPIAIAEQFARLAQWNKFIPLVYIVVVFYLLPFSVVWLGD